MINLKFSMILHCEFRFLILAGNLLASKFIFQIKYKYNKVLECMAVFHRDSMRHERIFIR